MERFTYIDSINELYNKRYKLIGKGSEGSAYLMNNKKVIKVIDDEEIKYRGEMFAKDKDKIIMMQDLELESFYFPEKLFICGDKIVGYICNYFGEDLLNIDNDYLYDDSEIKKTFPLLSTICNARERVIEDLRILTKNKIVLYDTCFNILFDGQRFGAIDTLWYRRDKNITLDKNIKYLDYSILFELATKYNDYYKIDESISFKENVKRLKKSLN